MSNRLIIGIILEESRSCRCCNRDALVSYCTEGVSFNDNISNVGFKFLSLEGLPIQVLFWALGVQSNAHLADMCFLGVED